MSLAPLAKTGVYWIPAAKDEDPDEELKELAQRRSPIRLFAEDVVLLMKNLTMFPDAILPIKRVDRLPGVEVNPVSLIYGYSIVGLLGLLEIPMIVCAFPAFLLLPGWAFLLAGAATYAFIYLLTRTTWGTRVIESSNPLPSSTIKRFSSEKWIFLNGIATSHAQLDKTVCNLSATFQRPVTGIHNRSFGFVGDLIECLVQRSFSYHTQDVRIAEASLIAALTNDTITKVVLIAHSQGGIIVSLVLDRLYAILPAELFRKIEIYTFGSAAAFFHNPLTKHSLRSRPASPTASRALSRAKSSTDPMPAAKTSLDGHSPPPPEIPNRLIPVIEHYVNAYDLVPRWGVLNHILLGTGTTYSGRVFLHDKTSGHLFDEHYLATMFPLGEMERIRSGDEKCFLNHAVGLFEVEVGDGGKGLDGMGSEREREKEKKPKWGIWRASTWARKREQGSTEQGQENGSSGRDSAVAAVSGRDTGFAASGHSPFAANGIGDGLSVSEDHGLTVRQLSKLWRYMDGGSA